MNTRSFLPLLLVLLMPLLHGCIGPRLSNPLGITRHRSAILVGPTAGLNRNFHTGGFRTIDEPSCPVFQEGTGWGPSVGFSAEFYTNLDATWSIIPRFMFESRPGEFQQRLPDVPILVDGASAPINQSVVVGSDVMYRMLSAEVFYKKEFADVGAVRFAVAGGPSMAYVVGGTSRQVQDLIDPDNARFTNPSGLPVEDGGRRLILFDDDIPGRNELRFSLKAGVQAEVGLFHNAWIMTPGVYYDYGITDVTAAENWQLNSLMFVVDFRYGF